jgi:hypothetical protein
LTSSVAKNTRAPIDTAGKFGCTNRSKVRNDTRQPGTAGHGSAEIVAFPFGDRLDSQTMLGACLLAGLELRDQVGRHPPPPVG